MKVKIKNGEKYETNTAREKNLHRGIAIFLLNFKEEVFAMTQDIERVFIVKEVPKDLIPFETKKVYQNYLSVSKDTEIRIRLQDENGVRKYDMAFKNGTGLTRVKENIKIKEVDYYNVSNKIDEKPLVKFRQFYPLGDGQVMIDQYLETSEQLMLAEVEFSSEEEAKTFVPPVWFGEEVTYNENFKNKNLWKKFQH